MAFAPASTKLPNTARVERAQRCRTLAIKADEQAAEAADPEMRATFLSMKELWLKLANEIDRRQRPSYPPS